MFKPLIGCTEVVSTIDNVVVVSNRHETSKKRNL